MAVDKAKVVTRLKALFPKANLSQKRMDAIADKLAKKPADDADDAAIDAVINDFNDIMSIEDIAKEDDRLRSLEESKKKAEKDAEEAKRKAEGKTGDDPEKKDDDIEVDKDTPEWAKALIKQNRTLAAEIETIKTGTTTATKTEQAKAALEKSEVLKAMKPEIKERWLKRVDINSETPFEDQVKDLESEFTELYQVSADQNQYSGAAGSGGTASTADQKDVDAIVGNII